eukprot:CAMPEP_0185915974 /NCGR_PEP_ID=MMETSP0924C-20121207/2934_1 /TAXON_ID=321610 /ORGANISM="Perkinsus chesapeaki, Strain ATCC PRA-65" /LENGTH=39 /DNA_ID= /DNA_START= /DNA_END= /DNA_ORIENTATION=
MAPVPKNPLFENDWSIVIAAPTATTRASSSSSEHGSNLW